MVNFGDQSCACGQIQNPAPNTPHLIQGEEIRHFQAPEVTEALRPLSEKVPEFSIGLRIQRGIFTINGWRCGAWRQI